jgi:hypothetical protein
MSNLVCYVKRKCRLQKFEKRVFGLKFELKFEEMKIFRPYKEEVDDLKVISKYC